MSHLLFPPPSTAIICNVQQAPEKAKNFIAAMTNLLFLLLSFFNDFAFPESPVIGGGRSLSCFWSKEEGPRTLANRKDVRPQ